MRCDQCKFWNAGDAHTAPAGTCGRGKSRNGFPVDATTKAWAEDNESYAAYLVTKPDFGCVMFEQGAEIPHAPPHP